MIEYHVTWSIQLDAETPEDAARQAQAILQDPDSIATIFDVSAAGEYSDPIEVDLLVEEDKA
jgi:hypothetical protein